jgi:serine/threonine-protein kinase
VGSQRLLVADVDGTVLGDDAALERFAREARSTLRVDSPHAVKVLDFGVSKIITGRSGDDDWDDKSALTKTGVVMGTPYYVSPEQARALRDVDARTDVYSCGVVLYEALTGELPFDASHFNALLLRVLEGNAKPPRELRPDIPVELEAVIAKAMAVDREQRYGTAREMSRALAPFVK